MDSYHEDRPWSFGAKNDLYKLFKRGEVDEALAKSNVYTRFKQHRKPKRFSPIYVYRKRELFQSDVVFFTNKDLVSANGGYKYLLTTIDVFTKMVWVYPMKENTCNNVMLCFKDILSKCGEKPERLNTDRGSEMICKKFENYLKENKIHHYLSYSLRKCPVVERFNLTIQSLLYKIMSHNRSLEWVKFLDQAMKIYLNRKHRTIKMSPIEGDKDENEVEIRNTYLKKYIKAGLGMKKPKYSVGDTVRIFKERGNFHRGYLEDFTTEYFIIEKVLKNLPVPRYNVKDYNGEPIRGKFFEDELVLYKPPEFFESEVLKKRKTKRGVEYLVHYIGYPDSMNEWIKASDLKSL